MEFRTDAQHAYGFSLSQLYQYTVEPNVPEQKDGPVERMTLGFSTADVVVTGWRLERFTEGLRSHKGGIVRTLPDAARYQNLEPNACAIAEIKILPIGK